MAAIRRIFPLEASVQKGEQAVKRLKLRQGIIGYLADNRMHYIAVALILLAGAAAGAVSAVSVSGDKYESLHKYLNNFVSVYNLQPVSKLSIFKTSVYGNIKLILFLWISGLWIGLIPFAALQMGIKGFKLGFSSAFFVLSYKGKGLLFAFAALLPQLMLLVPALTVFTVFNIKYALSLHRMRDRNSRDLLKRDMYLRNFLCMTGITVIAVFCSFVDAFVVPPVLKPLCSFLAG